MGKTASDCIPDVSCDINFIFTGVKASEKRMLKTALIPKGQKVTGERRNCNEEAHNVEMKLG
jgi:hypothetical protein